MQVWSVQPGSSGVVDCGVVVISEAVSVVADISVVVVVSGFVVEGIFSVAVVLIPPVVDVTSVVVTFKNLVVVLMSLWKPQESFH